MADNEVFLLEILNSTKIFLFELLMPNLLLMSVLEIYFEEGLETQWE